MTVKIVLPYGDRVKTAAGTEVFTSSGEKIEGITKIEIMPMHVDAVVEAKLTVAVSEIENFNGVHAVIKDMPIELIEHEAQRLGYKLVKDE